MWIFQVGVGGLEQGFFEIFLAFETGHGQVVEQPGAAVFGAGAGYVAFKLGNELERVAHERQDVARRELSAHEEVVARETAHRTPIDDAVAPVGTVAQIGGRKVLNGVDGPLAKHRFAVGQFHTDVESGDDFAAHLVLTRHVDAAVQAQMVDGEAGYFFHKVLCDDVFIG